MIRATDSRRRSAVVVLRPLPCAKTTIATATANLHAFAAHTHAHLRRWARAGGRVVLGLALALDVGGCEEEQDSVRIGAVISTTGVLAEVGATQLEAMAMAAEQVNEAGGIHGRNLRIAHRDDGTDPARARRVTEGMQEEIVPVLIGGVDDELTVAIAETLTRDTLMLTASATSTRLAAEIGRARILRTCATSDNQVSVLVARALQKGQTRIAIVHTADRTEHGIARPFHLAFVEAGGTITARKELAVGRQTYQSSLENVLASAPQAVLLDTNSVDGAVIVRGWIDSSVAHDVTWYFSDALEVRSFIDSVGSQNFDFAHEGIGPSPALDEHYEHFVTSFTRRYDSPPAAGAYAAQAYDAVLLAALGLLSAESDDSLAVRAAIEANATGGTPYGPADLPALFAAVAAGDDVDFTGASGSLDLGPLGTAPPRYDIWTVRGGNLAFVERGVLPTSQW